MTNEQLIFSRISHDPQTIRHIPFRWLVCLGSSNCQFDSILMVATVLLHAILVMSSLPVLDSYNQVHNIKRKNTESLSRKRLSTVNTMKLQLLLSSTTSLKLLAVFVFSIFIAYPVRAKSIQRRINVWRIWSSSFVGNDCGKSLSLTGNWYIISSTWDTPLNKLVKFSKIYPKYIRSIDQTIKLFWIAEKDFWKTRRWFVC